MRTISLAIIFVTTISVCVLVNAYPTDKEGVGENSLSDLYEITPDEAPVSALSGETSTRRRVKRSDIVAFIRQFCPPLANFINSVYQRVKKIVFQILGKLLLGGNKNKAGEEKKPMITLTLPTYPPGDEEETTTEELDAKFGGSTTTEDGNVPADDSSTTGSTSSASEIPSLSRESTSSGTFSSDSPSTESSSPSETTPPADTTSTSSSSSLTLETTSTSPESASSSENKPNPTNELESYDLIYDNYDC